MKEKSFLALYLIGVIFTNSYVRMHRMAEWNKDGRVALNDYEEVVEGDHIRNLHARNTALAFVASVLWPVYVTSCVADTIVCTNIDIEPPEILQTDVPYCLDLSK